MSSPAFRALKESTGCRLTLLTSPMGALIAPYVECIDDVIEYSIPWEKITQAAPDDLTEIIDNLKKRNFDAAIIFSDFSQNPLPVAMLAFLAGIPVRAGFCRENPNGLLTHWLPEKEPYTFIRHQVRRDLDMVKLLGATTRDEKINLKVPTGTWKDVQEKLLLRGFNFHKRWVVLHPGVREKKREYPFEHWVETGRRLVTEFDAQVIISGSKSEKALADGLAAEIGDYAISMAGGLDVSEFISLVKHAPLIISVNTSAIHIAAATDTPVIVLHALSNPQHTPWRVPGKVLLFDVEEVQVSSNEVLKYVREQYFAKSVPMVTPESILESVAVLLSDYNVQPMITEVITLHQPALIGQPIVI